jgi:hypothetical protein
MVRDFGPGLTADELIGMTAWQINRVTLPPGDAFEVARQGSVALSQAGGESDILEELWADGHSVWLDPETQKPIVVTPSGQIVKTKD